MFNFLSFLTVCLFSVAQAASPTSSSQSLIGYWGQNLAKSQFTSVADHEQSLATFCKSTNYAIYHVSYMFLHFDAAKNAAIDLDLHCLWPTNGFNGYPKATKGFNALNCPNVGKDIITCQALGKKVMLSISPLDFIPSIDAAKQSATQVYNQFLGGTHQYRPFGQAIMDGIDVHVWNNDPNPSYYVAFIQKIRELMNQDSSRTYYIAGSAVCQYPDYLLGGVGRPNTILAVEPTIFDYLTAFFVSSPNICGWTGNNAGFYSVAAQWINFIKTNTPTTKFYVGLPSWYVPEWAQAANGDYILPTQLVSENVVPRLRTLGGADGQQIFAGFSLQDVSYDWLNKPCFNFPTWRYSDVIYQQLMLSSEYSGNNTSAANRCNTTSPSGTMKPTSSSTTPRSTRTLDLDENKSCIFLGTCEDPSVSSASPNRLWTIMAFAGPLVVMVLIGVL
ncbi:glycoside hydrolase superfamily [Phlyctochytrium arcticum]|nr:glycoside hydrolase superfamily [Phlyctochytrium arcticum]